MTKIHHFNLHGDRDEKYNWLVSNDFSSTNWKSIQSEGPLYFLVPQDTGLLAEYEKGWKITDIMPVNGVGMTTARDHVVIDLDEEELLKRVTFFRDCDLPDEEVCQKLSIPLKKGWNLQKARTLIRQESDLKKHIKTVTYRPFDDRYIFYHDSLVWRTVKKIMINMLSEGNLGLSTNRTVEVGDWNHAFVFEALTQHHSLSLKEVNYLFPLYICSGEDSFNEHHDINFSNEFLEFLAQKLGGIPELESIFYYIYAILHAPSYRQRYAEFLKTDFPRLPFTSDKILFKRMAERGKELIDIHLFKAKKISNLTCQFVSQDKRVVSPGYPQYSEEKVVVNKQGDGFTGVPEEVWNFYVGGYQVCHKWLKDRKGRTLSDDDILHYQKIIVALQETIRIMQQIDDAIPSWPIE